MKEITMKLYGFTELSEPVRKEIVERERWDIMESDTNVWNIDWMNSLSEFEKMTDTKVRGWEVGYCGYRFGSIRYKHDGPVLGDYENGYYDYELKGKYLFRYLNRKILPYIEKKKTYFGKPMYDEHGKFKETKKRTSRIISSNDDCFLTGFCGDYNLLKPIVDYCAEWPKFPEKTWEDLLEECYEGFFEDWHGEYKACASDNYVEERLSEDDCLYFEDGTKFRHMAKIG